MSWTFSRRMARATVLAALAAPGAAFLPETAPFAVTRAHAAPTIADFKATLASYGSFVAHPRYGEVWVPTVTPEGWRPYLPCNWIYEKDYGWYYDDKTPWGEIVHHYGRWTHEAERGWMWVVGEEWSPGWVVWRSSQDYIGWAPTPPDQDVKSLSAAAFNNDKFWTFMEAKKFGNSCTSDGAVVTSQVPVLLRETRYVTETKFVNGIAVYVLPPIFVGPVVDLDIFVYPWSPVFITSVFFNWIWIWTYIDIDIHIACIMPFSPAAPALSPIHSSPPPPPPGRRADDPPRRDPPRFTPPPDRGPPSGWRPPGRTVEPNDPPTGRPIPPNRRPVSFPDPRPPQIDRDPPRIPNFDPPRVRLPRPRVDLPPRLPRPQVDIPSRLPRPQVDLPPRLPRPNGDPVGPRPPRRPGIADLGPNGPTGGHTPRPRPPRLTRPNLNLDGPSELRPSGQRPGGLRPNLIGTLRPTPLPNPKIR